MNFKRIESVTTEIGKQLAVEPSANKEKRVPSGWELPSPGMLTAKLSADAQRVPGELCQDSWNHIPTLPSPRQLNNFHQDTNHTQNSAAPLFRELTQSLGYHTRK